MGPKKKDNKEKLKREELERKAKEEEQIRLAEMRLRELEEKKRRAKEERQRQREEEERRFAEVTERLNEELQSKQNELVKWKEDRLKQLQWEAFTGNDTPHPSDEMSVNTYLNLFQERQREGDLHSVMEELASLFKIRDDTKPLICGDGLPEPSVEEVDQYEKNLERIKRLIMGCLDRCTMQCLMSDSKEFLGPDGHNILVETQTLNDRLTYCLWGNVAKDPRFGEINFETSLKISFELPRRLLYEDVAVKILQLDFDLLSPQCHTYKSSQSRSNVSMTESIASVMTTMSEDEDEDDEEEKELRKELETLTVDDTKKIPSSSRVSSSRSSRPQRDTAVSAASGGPVENDNKVALSTTNIETEGEKTGEEGEAEQGKEGNEEEEAVLGEGGGEGNKNDIALKEDEVNLRTHAIAGKIFHIELLTMPPEAKIAGTWKIRQVFDMDNLIPFSHPPASILAPPSNNQTPNYSQDIVEFKNFKLPETYLFSENPILAQWDDAENIWRTERIRDPEYNLEERTVDFKTLFFSPIAVFVDRYYNMPYQNWELHAKGLDCTELVLEGAVASIAVKIEGNTSTLIGPEDQPHLTDLLNKPKTAHQLIDGLKKVGSFFFPEPDASRYSSVTKKRSAVEMEGYRSMALSSCGYSFCWSHWNSAAPVGKIVMGVAEANQKSWSIYVGGKKSYRLKLTEDDETFSLDPQEGATRNPGLYAALKSDASAATKECLTAASSIHMESVLCWLNATKPLTLA